MCVCDGVTPPPGGHLTRMKCTCVPACGPSGLRMGSCGGLGRSGKLCGRYAWVRGWGHHVQVQGEGSPCMGAKGGTEVQQVMG